MRLHLWQVGLVALLGVLLGCTRAVDHASRGAPRLTPVVNHAEESSEPAYQPFPGGGDLTNIPRELPTPGRDGGPALPALAGRAPLAPPVPPRPPAALRPAPPQPASSAPSAAPPARPLTSAQRAAAADRPE